MPSSRTVLLVTLILALAWAGVSAVTHGWTTDDAFISFRYARNLVEGHGLVFNQGERVEGYSNLLWTLWTAVGLALGLSAEAWASTWGIVFYLASVALLVFNHRRLAGDAGSPFLPLAALGAAAHRDWSIFATSGLETSLYTFLLLAGFLLVTRAPARPRALAAAGFVMGLAALTRPDGVLPAFVCGLFVLACSRPRATGALAYGACFAAVWLPFTLWRVGYYGDFFPNTYYAKSAYLAWWSQGWSYTRLYFEKYWALLLGPTALVAGLTVRAGRERAACSTLPARQAILAGALSLLYLLYVMRTGGDFMFARFLIPITPLLLLLAELAALRLGRLKPFMAPGFAALVLLGMLLTPVPVTGSEWRYGVADEWRYYSKDRVARLDHSAAVLGAYFDGLPVRVAFYGDEARVVYRARFAVAIESHACLTEPGPARRELSRRGRPGHEKHASAEYLIRDRGAHFTFSGEPLRIIRIAESIPDVRVRFADEVYGLMLHWDPQMVGALRARGLEVPDFPALLDRYIADVDRLPADRVARDLDRFRLFYFDHVDDPAREHALLARLR